MRHAFILVILLSSGLNASAQVAAAEPALIPYGIPGLREGSVDFGDLDRDGDLDLIVSGITARGDPVTRVYALQDSAWTQIVGGAVIQHNFKVYRPIETTLNRVWSGAARWGDFDGDGDDDVVLMGLTNVERTVDSTVVETVGQLYRNENGVLVQRLQLANGLHSGDAAWGDMDGDGDEDLALCGAANPEPPYEPTTMVLESRNGTMVPRETGLPGLMVCALAWGDMDGDGDLDLALSGESAEGTVADVFENTGDAGFVPMDAALPMLMFGSLDWADYDQDGRDDLVAAGGVLDPALLRGVVTVLRSTPSGMVAVETGNVPGVLYGSAAWVDWDRDGRPDLIVSGAETVLGTRSGRILLSRPDGFTSELILAGLTAGDITVGDYNGDGDPDVLYTGENDAGAFFVNFLMNRTFPEPIPAETVGR